MRLIIDGFGKSITKRDNQIVIRENGEELDYFLAKDLKQIIINGKGAITFDAIELLSDNDVDVIAIDWRGNIKYRLSSMEHNNVEIRKQQYYALNDKRSGLKYCKTLFYCVLLSYYDRFHCFDKMAVLRLFSWSFMIRLDMQHLGYDTINKYAIGEYNTLYSNNRAVFSMIANARKHTDISNLTINCKSVDNDWKDLSVLLLKLNGLYHDNK